MICPNCSTLNPKNVTKCVSCGTKLSTSELPKAKKAAPAKVVKNKPRRVSGSGGKIKENIKKTLKKVFLYAVLIGGLVVLYNLYAEKIFVFFRTNKYTADIYHNISDLTISEEELARIEQMKKDSINQIVLRQKFIQDSLNQVKMQKVLKKKEQERKINSDKDFNFYEVMKKKNSKQFVHQDTTVYLSKSDADAAQKYKKGTTKTDKFIYGKDQKKMMLVSAQTITLGDNSGSHFEKPEHKVSVNSFYMDMYEVTNIEFRKFMHDAQYQPKGRLVHLNDPRFNGDRQPIVDVAYEDALAYAVWAGKRLPTEAEWVAAAREGKASYYPTGDSITKLQANFGEYIKLGKTKIVGSYKPNTYGIYDLAGNAAEWVYGMLSKYPGNTVDHSYYNKVRLTKGGSWMSPERDLKCTGRAIKHFYDSGVIGFRCVVSKK